jgi:hypothetical protein
MYIGLYQDTIEARIELYHDTLAEQLALDAKSLLLWPTKPWWLPDSVGEETEKETQIHNDVQLNEILGLYLGKVVKDLHMKSQIDGSTILVYNLIMPYTNNKFEFKKEVHFPSGFSLPSATINRFRIILK